MSATDKVVAGDPLTKISATVYNKMVDVVSRLPATFDPPIDDGGRPPTAIVRFDSNATPGGLYKGTAVIGDTNRYIENLGVVSNADYFPANNSLGVDCYIFNWGEKNTTTHTVAVNTVLPAIRCGGVADANNNVIPLFHVGGVGGGVGGAKWFKATSSATNSCTAQGWNGTALDGTSVTIRTIQGHAVGDLLFAAPAASTDVAGTAWIELFPPFSTSGQRFKVLQLVDATGRFGFDFVRAS